MYDKLSVEILERIRKLNPRAFGFNRANLEHALSDACAELPIKTDRIDILVSDGEEYKLPPHHYCGYREFHQFSDINIDDFCHFVRDHAYVRIGTEI